ncbi:MAG: DUF3344 domain-containing protein [Methanobrevibacter sp.]|nr:DUF3344 domain-containing protein [Candidatus Methanovirga basalitermitum]
MIIIKKYTYIAILSLIAIFITTFCIAASDSITINGLTGEYTSGSTSFVYQGTENQLNTTISSDGGTYNGEAILYADNVEVARKSVSLTSSSTPFNITDPTIRNITNDIYNITYNLTLSMNNVNSSVVKNISVAYNGYLGKEFSPSGDDSITDEYTINGHVLMDAKDPITYLNTTTNSRTDIFKLANDNIVKVFAYVPYNWGNNFNTVKLTCNDQRVSEYQRFDDKSNLGSYGNRTYGVRIFDITGYVHKGDNIIAIEKDDVSAALYPTVFVTLTNESVGTNKKVYINNGADLLSTNYNKLNREVSSNSLFKIENPDNIKNAELYSIFSSVASGEVFDLFFNGNLVDIAHEGHDNATDYVSENVTKFITNGVNKASFKLENSQIETATTLSKILVLENNKSDSLNHNIELKSNPIGSGLLKTGFPLGILLLILLSMGTLIIRRRK